MSLFPTISNIVHYIPTSLSFFNLVYTNILTISQIHDACNSAAKQSYTVSSDAIFGIHPPGSDTPESATHFMAKILPLAMHLLFLTTLYPLLYYHHLLSSHQNFALVAHIKAAILTSIT
eukprot:Phypoly_transcript_04396.p1 GENE.Phypoly_transcript_04396~~Phypoly_transcript_04396.p1  ORF type:complete len:119 (-),score=13.32 Phypoly_transcript_04396:146-502(-)